MFEHTISEDEAGMRVDKLARKLLPDVPLSGIYKIIRTRRIRVNGKRTRPEAQLQAGDVVEFRVVQPAPGTPIRKPPPKPQRMPEVPILYEDDAILAVDKPAGMAIHAGTGIHTATLVDWGRAYLEVPEDERRFKASPAHRLDKDTSGVVIIAKTRQAMVGLTEIFTKDEAEKAYLTLVQGRLKRPRGTIDTPLAEHEQSGRSRAERGINMQPATTHYRVLAAGKGASLLECRIETGRTHQIRRHLAAIGHPVAGDTRYGDFPFNRRIRQEWGLRRQFLHARRLAFAHPITGKALSFEAPLPRELVEVLQAAGIAWSLSAKQR